MAARDRRRRRSDRRPGRASRPPAAAAALGTAAAAALADEYPPGKRRLRARLPQSLTHNVVCELGTQDAERTVVVVAHHDAAHSGWIFHPAIPETIFHRAKVPIELFDTSPALMWPLLASPLLAVASALTGSRLAARLGALLGFGYAASMAQIGSREVVPGANDNATAVVLLLELARRLLAEPTASTRVILLSTGAEESFSEGMKAFGERHFDELPRDRTFFLCVDTVGSPTLNVLRGEGFLRMREYTPQALELLDGLADELKIETVPNLRLRNGTDGLEPLAPATRPRPCARSPSSSNPPTTTGRPTPPRTSTTGRSPTRSASPRRPSAASTSAGSSEGLWISTPARLTAGSSLAAVERSAISCGPALSGPVRPTRVTRSTSSNAGNSSWVPGTGVPSITTSYPLLQGGVSQRTETVVVPNMRPGRWIVRALGLAAGGVLEQEGVAELSGPKSAARRRAPWSHLGRVDLALMPTIAGGCRASRAARWTILPAPGDRPLWIFPSSVAGRRPSRGMFFFTLFLPGSAIAVPLSDEQGATYAIALLCRCRRMRWGGPSPTRTPRGAR